MRSRQGAAAVAAPDPESPHAGAIVKAGANCWRVERADRFYCVQDGAEYFRLVRQALLSARYSVLILGWDIAGRLDLLPDRSPEEAKADPVPSRLDSVLGYIVRRNRALRCDILIWDYASLYTLERDPLSRLHLGWGTPRRVRFGYDDRHPIGGSHHQKIIVIDDRLAFCGSIDLTSHRWDTVAHRVEEPARTSGISNTPYGPYHEVQAMVEGPVAARLGDLARERWRALGDTKIAPPPARTESLWPVGVNADLSNVSVGIARTQPGGGDEPATREVEKLFIDSIAAARRSIYIESQYFTSPEIGRALAERLKEPHGPEIVVVTSRECSGWLEQKTMGVLRESIFQELTAVDHGRRLRLVCPIASRSADVATFIHSKVMTVDDSLLRIGSANAAHRSLGLDTECDLAADAAGDPAAEQGIRRVRNRLLAEHLGLDPKQIADANDSIRDLIDRYGSGDRTLTPIEVVRSESQAASSESILAAADPYEPLGFGPAIERLMPWVDATTGRSALRLWILPAIAVTAALIAAWASTGDLRRAAEFQQLQQFVASTPASGAVMAAGVACFVVAAALFVPVELLILLSGIVFGFTSGSVVAFAGSIAAACVTYATGRSLGEARLPRWISRRSYRTTRQTCARGPMAIALFRLSAPTGAGAIDLACGASRVPFLAFFTGAALAYLPVIPAIAAIGALFRQLILHPSVWNGMTTIAAAIVLIAIAALVRTVVLVRQFRPAAEQHRSRAEFG